MPVAELSIQGDSDEPISFADISCYACSTSTSTASITSLTASSTDQSSTSATSTATPSSTPLNLCATYTGPTFTLAAYNGDYEYGTIFSATTSTSYDLSENESQTAKFALINSFLTDVTDLANCNPFILSWKKACTGGLAYLTLRPL